jgi:hypothetical protein
LAEVATNAPAALVTLVESMLAADPAARPHDLRRLANQLRSSVDVESVQPAPPAEWAAVAAAALTAEPAAVESTAVEPDAEPEVAEPEAAEPSVVEPVVDLTVETPVSTPPVATPVAVGAGDPPPRLPVVDDTAPITTTPPPEHSNVVASEPVVARDEPHIVDVTTEAPRSRRPLLFAGAAAALVVLVVALVAMLGGGGGGNDTATRVSEDLPGETTVAGLTLGRAWSLTGKHGDHLEVRLNLANPTAAPVSETVVEVIPKSVASSADKVDVNAGRAIAKVLEKDPVFAFRVNLDSNATATIVLRAKVPGDGATKARLDKYVADREAAVADYTKRTAAPEIAITSHPNEGTITDATQTLSGTVTEGSDVVLTTAGTTCDPLPAPLPATVNGTTWSFGALPLVNAPGRVCVIVVASHNGKTTTARLGLNFAPAAAGDPDPDKDGINNDGTDQCPDVTGNSLTGCPVATGRGGTTPTTRRGGGTTNTTRGTTPPTQATTPPTQATTPPTQATTPTTQNHAPVLNIVPYVVDMADDQVPSWDQFSLGSDDVTDADGDSWTYNTYSADSGAQMYTAACSGNGAYLERGHGCLYYYDDGSCGDETIYVTVKDSKGAVSNQDYFIARYC